MVQSCSSSSRSATWSSWTRVRCQTSQPMEFAPGAGDQTRSSGAEPVDHLVHVFGDPAEQFDERLALVHDHLVRSPGQPRRTVTLASGHATSDERLPRRSLLVGLAARVLVVIRRRQFDARHIARRRTRPTTAADTSPDTTPPTRRRPRRRRIRRRPNRRRRPTPLRRPCRSRTHRRTIPNSRRTCRTRRSSGPSANCPTASTRRCSTLPSRPRSVPTTPTPASVRSIVVKGGEIVYERYHPLDSPDQATSSFSVAKSFTSAIVGMLIGDGRLELDAPAPVEEWQADGDPRQEITLEDLMRMSSGLEWEEEYGPGSAPVADAPGTACGRRSDLAGARRRARHRVGVLDRHHRDPRRHRGRRARRRRCPRRLRSRAAARSARHDLDGAARGLDRHLARRARCRLDATRLRQVRVAVPARRRVGRRADPSRGMGRRVPLTELDQPLVRAPVVDERAAGDVRRGRTVRPADHRRARARPGDRDDVDRRRRSVHARRTPCTSSSRRPAERTLRPNGDGAHTAYNGSPAVPGGVHSAADGSVQPPDRRKYSATIA